MSNTELTIEAGKFYINGKPTYAGRKWRGIEIEGLLINTRMVQAAFDDANPDTVAKWRYPDTNVWDAERNVREFVSAMPSWRNHGVLGFTINLQGGSPEGYSKAQPWINSAFLPDGQLDANYMQRVDHVISTADELGMIVIVGYFYFGQSGILHDETAVETAVREATTWLIEREYRNCIIEINNECDINDQHTDGAIGYRQENLQKHRVHELIRYAQDLMPEKNRIPVGTSYIGGTVPGGEVIEASDVVFLHGNDVDDPDRIAAMVKEVCKAREYRGQPILFNEDDHFRFDEPVNNMLSALSSGASWGYFDPGESNYRDGYQCPPVRWDINTERKKKFFEKVKEITLL